MSTEPPIVSPRPLEAARRREAAVHEVGASAPVFAVPGQVANAPVISAHRAPLERVLRDGVLVGVPGRTRAPCRVPCTRPLDPALDARLRAWLRARSDIPREAPIRLGEWISTDVRSLPHAVWIVVGDGASARDAVLPCASAALVAADIAALDLRARG
jgi:hypothetical protein